MQQVFTLQELWQALAALPAPLGLVPTMGYLHLGHLSLVQRARQECASVAVSIFVNPTQFGANEDLSKYPRNLQRDLQMLKETGAHLVWTPSPEELYPAGYQTWVTVEEISRPLEGAMRPGHFRGVATVVAKLFNATRPARAYFGQKDAQQVAVLRQMTRDLSYPTEIIICPTLREADGLAMSSRNVYLTPAQRAAAPVLYRALQAAALAHQNGERRAEALREQVRAALRAEPQVRLQYVSCADYDTLQELETVQGKALLSLAAYAGETRLIDNFVLGD